MSVAEKVRAVAPADSRLRVVPGAQSGDATFVICECSWRFRLSPNGFKTLQPAAAAIEASAKETHSVGRVGGAYAVAPPVGSAVADRGVAVVVCVAPFVPSFGFVFLSLVVC
jgi:hypothetical protein